MLSKITILISSAQKDSQDVPEQKHNRSKHLQSCADILLLIVDIFDVICFVKNACTCQSHHRQRKPKSQIKTKNCTCDNDTQSYKSADNNDVSKKRKIFVGEKNGCSQPCKHKKRYQCGLSDDLWCIQTCDSQHRQKDHGFYQNI